MTLGKGDPVPPPPAKGEYHIKFANRAASEGWQELMNQAPGPTLDAWMLMRTGPAPSVHNRRHHPLKHELATGVRNGKTYPQWQIEVTGGGRVWYLHDLNAMTCWVTLAKTGHPRQTD